MAAHLLPSLSPAPLDAGPQPVDDAVRPHSEHTPSDLDEILEALYAGEPIESAASIDFEQDRGLSVRLLRRLARAGVKRDSEILREITEGGEAALRITMTGLRNRAAQRLQHILHTHAFDCDITVGEYRSMEILRRFAATIVSINLDRPTKAAHSIPRGVGPPGDASPAGAETRRRNDGNRFDTDAELQFTREPRDRHGSDAVDDDDVGVGDRAFRRDQYSREDLRHWAGARDHDLIRDTDHTRSVMPDALPPDTRALETVQPQPQPAVRNVQAAPERPDAARPVDAPLTAASQFTERATFNAGALKPGNDAAPRLSRAERRRLERERRKSRKQAARASDAQRSRPPASSPADSAAPANVDNAHPP